MAIAGTFLDGNWRIDSTIDPLISKAVFVGYSFSMNRDIQGAGDPQQVP